MELTPKEKAKELYNMFDMIIYSDQDEHDQCKRCSVRCVEQMQDVLMNGEDCSFENASKVMYLQEVKQEINKL